MFNIRQKEKTKEKINFNRIFFTHYIAISVLLINAIFLTKNEISITVQIILGIIVFIHNFDDERLIKKTMELNNTLEQKVQSKTSELKEKVRQLENFQEILQHQQKYVKAIMDSQANIIITTDGNNIRNTNKAFLEFFKVKDIEDFEKKYGLSIGNTFEKGYAGCIELEMGKEKWIEYVINRPKQIHKAVIKIDNKEYIFSIKANKFEFENQTFMSAVFVDITDIEYIKYQLEIAKNKAEESTKLKSEFLANMSHEIRTPMNGIIGMSHLVLKTNLDEKQKYYIKKIDNSAKSLLEIINDILDFSKIEAGKLTIEKIDFDMLKILENSINLISQKVKEKNLKLIIDYDKSIGRYFYGDSLRISQILTNLLSNAVKFTHKGHIKISIKKDDLQRILFKVEDTGVGLTDEQTSKLFQAFTQADGSTTRRYGGTGLGLTISKQLVKLMNGSIWVESKYGEGSKFYFNLPLKKGDLTKIENSIHNTPTIIKTLKGSHILLAEDNKTNQEIVVGLLEDSGINIDIANNGQEAVDKFNSNQKYELIFMDLQMPIMSGIDATKKIREKDNTIPIIALTANAMKEDIEKTRKVGMNEHLNKPIDVKKLYTTLLKYISKKVDIDNSINKIQEEESSLPNFKYIDKSYGLKLVMNNEKIYIKILKGLYEFKDMNLYILNSDEFKRVVHTIKGLSASAGALTLHKIVEELDKTQDKALISLFEKEFTKVIEELASSGIFEEKICNKESISKEKRDELFEKLKNAAYTKRAKFVRPVLEELEKYKLSNEDSKIYKDIKSLISKFKFKDVVKLLEKEEEYV